jgi:hypothetical protein
MTLCPLISPPFHVRRRCKPSQMAGLKPALSKGLSSLFHAHHLQTCLVSLKTAENKVVEPTNHTPRLTTCARYGGHVRLDR